MVVLPPGVDRVDFVRSQVAEYQNFDVAGVMTLASRQQLSWVPRSTMPAWASSKALPTSLTLRHTPRQGRTPGLPDRWQVSRHHRDSWHSGVRLVFPALKGTSTYEALLAEAKTRSAKLSPPISASRIRSPRASSSSWLVFVERPVQWAPPRSATGSNSALEVYAFGGRGPQADVGRPAQDPHAKTRGLMPYARRDWRMAAGCAMLRAHNRSGG